MPRPTHRPHRAVLLAAVLASGALAAGCLSPRSASRAIAEAEIAALPVTYAWAVDAKDIDLLMTVFSDDVVYDLSAYGFPPAVGKEAVRRTFRDGVFEYVECSFIRISNFTVTIDGDRATGRDYFVHSGYGPRNRPPGTRSHTEGRHFFEFRRERGRWKIAAMRGRPFFERWEPFDADGLRECQTTRAAPRPGS